MNEPREGEDASLLLVMGPDSGRILLDLLAKARVELVQGRHVAGFCSLRRRLRLLDSVRASRHLAEGVVDIVLEVVVRAKPSVS